MTRRSWLGVAPAMLVVAWGGNHFSPLLLLYRQVERYSAVQVDLFFAFYVLGLVPASCSPARWSRTGSAAAPGGRGAGPERLSAAWSSGLGSASPAALCAGRFVSGVTWRRRWSPGTTWVKELSAAAAPGTVPVGRR